MTLVLPFGGNHISSFSGSGQCGSDMPCVFDGESFDREFESALMNEWSSEISDYAMAAEDPAAKAPSDANLLKRKSSEEEEINSNKKTRLSDDETSSVPTSESSSSEVSHEDEEEDEDPPRRRGPQMWNSRQRWKDERKKVLKMSISKMAEIEDPELCLLRSVLVNNTILRLHSDIRSERQMKLRHRQQRISFFTEPFFTSDSSDSSCDSMFGDFLHAPADRRASSPIPSQDVKSGDSPMADQSRFNNAPATSCFSTTTTSSTTASPGLTTTHSDTGFSPRCAFTDSVTTPCYGAMDVTTTTTSFTTSTSDYNRRPNGPQQSTLSPSQIPVFPSSAGSQCATQYRTNAGSPAGDANFPPRVPILDSVVYHSLLASLESS